MNWLAIVINSAAVLMTFVLMTAVLRSLKKRTRQAIRVERLTEEQRKAQEIAQWLAAIKQDSAHR